MRSRRSGHAGLAILLLATALTVGDWLPAPRAEAVPGTITRQVAVDLGELSRGTDLRASGAEEVRSDRAVLTPATVVCAPIRFTSVGLLWDQVDGPSPHAIVQAGNDERSFRREMEIQDPHGPDPGSGEGVPARRGTEPVWVHDARCLRLRLEIPAGITISNLRVMFLNTSGTAGVPTPWHPIEGTTTENASDVAGATANAPYWTTRPGWGADESLRNCDPSYADSLKMAFVHHTATENDYAKTESDDIVRSIYAYHTQGNGWCDIAYNFLVDKYGKVFVGRFGGPALPVIGAAQQGFNTGAVSVSGIGTYSATTPSAAMLLSIKKTIAWRLDVAHVPPKGWAWMVSAGGPNTKYPAGKGVTLRTVSGHRDTGYTSCPGDLLYGQLGAIREGAHTIGLPKMFRVKQTIEGITPGVDTVHYTATGTETLNWVVTITSQATLTPVRTFRVTATTLDVEWDGMQGLFPAPTGNYDVNITASNLTGGTARNAKFVLAVYDPGNELALNPG